MVVASRLSLLQRTDGVEERNFEKGGDSEFLMQELLRVRTTTCSGAPTTCLTTNASLGKFRPRRLGTGWASSITSETVLSQHYSSRCFKYARLTDQTTAHVDTGLGCTYMVRPCRTLGMIRLQTLHIRTSTVVGSYTPHLPFPAALLSAMILVACNVVPCHFERRIPSTTTATTTTLAVSLPFSLSYPSSCMH
jgi:hypothetical protein